MPSTSRVYVCSIQPFHLPLPRLLAAVEAVDVISNVLDRTATKSDDGSFVALRRALRTVSDHLPRSSRGPIGKGSASGVNSYRPARRFPSVEVDNVIELHRLERLQILIACVGS
jgi:hypothetical protein